MPGNRCHSRGASAVEYALAASVLVGLLLVVLQNVSDSASEGYDERQVQIATGVTDPSGGSSTSSTSGASTTVTLPPSFTTSTSTSLPVSTSSTVAVTSTTLGYTVAGVGSGTNQNQNFWRARVTVTVAPSPTSGTVSGTYRENGTGSPQSWSCNVSAGSCSFQTGNISRSSVANVVFTVTTLSANPTRTDNLPVTATAARPA